MSLEDYKKLYLFYQRRCFKLEAYLRSTEESIADFLKELNMKPAIEFLEGSLSSSSSRSTSGSNLNAMDAEQNDSNPSFEPGAGSMWEEEEANSKSLQMEKNPENNIASCVPKSPDSTVQQIHDAVDAWFAKNPLTARAFSNGLKRDPNVGDTD